MLVLADLAKNGGLWTVYNTVYNINRALWLQTGSPRNMDLRLGSTWEGNERYTAISRKVVGKSARDNPERCCGWFWEHFSSKKFERMVGEAMDIRLRVLKECSKSRFDSFTPYEQCIDHIPYYLSRLSRAHFFRQPFSKQLYIKTVAQSWEGEKMLMCLWILRSSPSLEIRSPPAVLKSMPLVAFQRLLTSRKLLIRGPPLSEPDQSISVT